MIIYSSDFECYNCLQYDLFMKSLLVIDYKMISLLVLLVDFKYHIVIDFYFTKRGVTVTLNIESCLLDVILSTTLTMTCVPKKIVMKGFHLHLHHLTIEQIQP
jgi:hypothetical protein